MNELVAMLYDRQISRRYELLHQASIEVRYGRGFRGNFQVVTDAAALIRRVYEDGALVAASRA